MQCQAKSSGGRHSAPSHREPQRQCRASLRVREPGEFTPRTDHPGAPGSPQARARGACRQPPDKEVTLPLGSEIGKGI